MTVTNLSNGSIILFLCPSFLEQLVYDKGINFQRPSNGRCPASGRSGGHEADDHRSVITEQATQGEYAHTYECGGSIGISKDADGISRHVGILEGSDANLHPKLSRVALIYTTE